MSINRKHPEYVEFIKNEHKTLVFLHNTPFIANGFNEISISAQNALQYFGKVDHKNIKRARLNFQTNFNIIIEKQLRKIIIEANVLQDFSMATYVISICEGYETPFDLMRKFHFDYALPSPKDEEKKPIYHLQYGGEQSPGLAALDINCDGIYPWLSSPRIHHAPMNLALLFDSVFVEFKNDVTDKIVKRPEWIKLIKENENKILVPYYLNMNRFITDQHKSDYLIRDFYYGD